MGDNKRNYRKEYVAGLIDGEGCIRLSRKKGKVDKDYFHPVIEVNMTNEEVIQYLFENVGGNMYIKEWDDSTGYKTVYRWTLNKKDEVEQFLKEILPFSIVKRTQIIELLKLSGSSYEEKLFIFDELKRLKQYG